MGAGASTRPAHQQPDGLYQHTRPRMGAGARSAGRALRVHQQPLHSAGATMQAPVLLHSAAGPLSAAASLPTPGPPRCRHLSARCRPASPAPQPMPPLFAPVSVAGLRSPRSLVLTYNVGRLKARLRAGSTARPKGLSGIPAPLGGPSCGGGPGSAGACARHAAPHIGPSRAGAAPLVGTPGPHPVKQCSTQGTASHPRRRFYQNGGRAGRCSLPGSSAEGQAVPHRKGVKAATLQRETPPAGGTATPATIRQE